MNEPSFNKPRQEMSLCILGNPQQRSVSKGSQICAHSLRMTMWQSLPEAHNLVGGTNEDGQGPDANTVNGPLVCSSSRL